MAGDRVKPSGKGQGDLVERVNRHWTFLFFLLLALVSLILPYVYPYAICSSPSHFTSSQVAYANSECAHGGSHGKIYASSSTWSSLRNDHVAINVWTPFGLVVMACVIKLPFLVWTQLQFWVGIDADAVISCVEEHLSARRLDSVKAVVDLTTLILRSQCNFSTSLLVLGRKLTSLLISLAMCLFIVITTELGTYFKDDEKSMYGPLKSRSSCQFFLFRADGDLKHYRALCVYPANIILQKMYAFLFFYCLFLFIFNLIDLIVWSSSLFIPHVRNQKLALYIRFLQGSNPPGHKRHSCPLDSQFASFLGFDGFLLLMRTSQISDELVWAELTKGLWENYQNQLEAELEDDKEKRDEVGEEPATAEDHFGKVKHLELEDQTVAPETVQVEMVGETNDAKEILKTEEEKV